MAWWQLTIQAKNCDIEKAEQALLDIGALSITLSDANDEPIFEPLPGETPLWSESIITGLFDQTHSIETLFDQLIGALPERLSQTIKQQTLADQVWEKAYLDHFKPTQFGQNLWIVPSWYDPIDETAINICLDPGVAFGTGSHPTTALCLEWLDQYSLKGKTVIDFGCGSGILGIACALKGAKNVIYTDIDPQALESTANNIEKNNMSYSADALVLPEKLKSKPVDILVANILSGPLIELSEYLATLVKPNGIILLSGILEQQQDEIITSYSQYFNCEAPTRKDTWIRVVGTKKS